MRRAVAVLALALVALLPVRGRCGVVGDTMGAYATAGMGVGALIGSAAATLPYTQTKQPLDFLTGAGIGMVVGCGVGMILGAVDLANHEDDAMGPNPGLALAWTPHAMAASWTMRF